MDQTHCPCTAPTTAQRLKLTPLLRSLHFWGNGAVNTEEFLGGCFGVKAPPAPGNNPDFRKELSAPLPPALLLAASFP